MRLLTRGRLKVALTAFAGALFMAGLLPVTALAADNREGQSVTIGPNEVVNDDLYVAATTIDIQGTINGNLFAVGTTITVTGTVTRDANIAGSEITLPGEIQGSARLAGNTVNVTGKIDGDLLAAGTTVTLSGAASVGRDVMAAGNTVTLTGPIARNAQLAGTNVELAGPIGGNVTAYDTSLKLDSGASIKGNLDYTSNQAVSMASEATVGGAVHHSYPSNGPTVASRVLGWIQTLVGFFLLGALIIFLAPRFNTRAVAAYRTEPWSRLGVGVAVLLVVPIVGLFAFVVGLIVGGWWLSLFLLAAYLFVAAVGFTVVGEMIGRFILERTGQPQAHPILALVLGLPILLILSYLPAIGWLFAVLAVVYGTGVTVMALPWSRPEAPQTPVVAAPPASVARPTPAAG